MDTNLENLIKALDACFGVMMQPTLVNTKDKLPYWSIPIAWDDFIEARARAEQMYYETKKTIWQDSE